MLKQIRHKISLTQFLIKKNQAKRSVWVCSCGQAITKKGAALSGDDTYKYSYHIHCPKCGKIVAQFVNPKETQ